MAFFNFRLPGTKGRDDKAPAVSSDSVEVMRRRARHRLIGATVLVTARWNPFYGLLAGLGIKLFFSL